MYKCLDDEANVTNKKGRCPGQAPTSANKHAQSTQNQPQEPNFPQAGQEIIDVDHAQQAAPQLLVQADMGNAILIPPLCKCRITRMTVPSQCLFPLMLLV